MEYPHLASCVENGGNEISLEVGKPYKVIAPGDPLGRIRLIDDGGEDYLFPRDWFVAITVPQHEERRVHAAVSILER